MRDRVGAMSASVIARMSVRTRTSVRKFISHRLQPTILSQSLRFFHPTRTAEHLRRLRAYLRDADSSDEGSTVM